MPASIWLTDPAFALREAMPWSLPARSPGPSRPEPASPEAAARLDVLASRHDLAPLYANTGPVERDESLYVLDLCTRYLSPPAPAARCLDVGSKYGAYLGGLATFAPGGWDLVERDAHRRYLSTLTRRAVGEAIAARWPGCRFHAGDVRKLGGDYARITWFLPFVFAEPHRAWGLPARSFDPAGTLRAVLDRLAPGGELLLVNQGEAEAEEQARLFTAAGVQATALGRVESPLSPFRKPRYGWHLATPTP